MSCKVRPYTFHSNLVATRSPYPLLRAGCLAAHRVDCLMLLGSPPDMVHNSQLRKTHSSTQQARLSRFELILKKGIPPCCSGFQVQGSANSPASMALFYSSLLYLYQDPYIITDFLDFCKCFFDFYLILKIYSSIYFVCTASRSSSTALTLIPTNSIPQAILINDKYPAFVSIKA